MGDNKILSDVFKKYINEENLSKEQIKSIKKAIQEYSNLVNEKNNKIIGHQNILIDMLKNTTHPEPIR